MSIPDAPWVREAELYGMPDYPEPVCPICGKEAERAFYDTNGELLGCDNCIVIKDASDDDNFYPKGEN